ncbi:hypothetical protein GCM10010218_37530 [Streptomyces mashuensis]|uniref:Uncharacterized protein n=1 Tax=Streptomyces mashuensis TaxID=33904 RepID=A0A919B5H8_9ACTN|nr:hypothetical protein [Streptomyces mashuensis]GHF52543.1 hypothetical protein GCM10010218_37530 [Streptomyces mashuensis]
MSPFLTALIASVTILAIILATDLGTRRVTNMRMLRSLLAIAIVIALFVHSLPHAGNDVSLQLVGIGVGVICGLIAASLLPAHRDPATGDVFTRGGIGYAAVWFVLSSARVLFAYGTEHWFPAGIIKFSIDYKLSGQDVYANAFIFMSLAMVLTRTAVLLTRRRRLLAAAPGTAPRSGDEQPAAHHTR